MFRVVLRSAATLLLSALAGSVVVFVMLRLIRGDIATIILGRAATPDALAALRADLGLDRTWLEQYLDWIGGLVRGDLGVSYAARFDIFSEITSRLGLTLSLAFISLVLSILAALALGTYSALNARNLRGVTVDVGAQLGIAIPSFWAGLLLIGYFAVNRGWFPAGGYVPWSVSVGGAIRSLTLPVIALSVPMVATMIRFVRSSMIEVLDEDFMRTAMAKGRTLRSAALIHGVRNAAIPLVTVSTLQLGQLFAGAVVIENVFTLPGLGRMLLSAVLNREAIVVQSLIFVVMLAILTMNFLMDILYGLLDPRIRDNQARARA